MGLKIQTTTAIGLLLAGLLPLIVLLSMFALSTRTELKQAALEERGTLTSHLATEVEGLLEGVVVDLNLIGSNPLLVTPGTSIERRNAELHRLCRDSRFTELALFDEDGYLIAASAEIAVTQDRSPWFERCVERSTTVVSDPLRFGGRDQLSVVAYESVPSELGSDVAVVRARIGFGSVWSILDDIGSGGHGEMYLVDASGNILYSADRSLIFRKAREVIGEIPFGVLRGSGLDYETDDSVILGQLVRPPLQFEEGREWSLVWKESKAQLFAALHSIYRQLLICTGVGLLSAILLGFVIERCLSRPLIAMSDVAGRTAAGESGLRMSPGGSRELRTLSNMFNEMMDRQEEDRGQLEDLVAERTTELQETISQLRQSQKMEAVGLMAGGIAHDFNNLLTTINGNTNLAIQSLADTAGAAEAVEFMRLAGTAGDRAAGVVRKLLAFSRKEDLQLRHEDINVLVEETRGIVGHSFGPEIKIVSHLEQGEIGIWADGTQIQQVLMNLCINAKDAMGEGGGRLSLTTGRRTVSGEGDSGHPEGEYVFASVGDTGAGIPEGELERIFEPFFTTKDPDKGSGLGLAMCYGIVAHHGGWIECDSKVGEGATFTILLPLHRAPKTDPEPSVVTRRRRGHAARSKPDISGETILLVDDEPAVRAIAEAVLVGQGCDVLTADNGQIALDICEERGEDLSLVILDGAMPVLNGQETFAGMARDYPWLPVIICSGNRVDDGSFRSVCGRSPEAFILKPYQFDQLIEQVEEVLATCLES